MRPQILSCLAIAAAPLLFGMAGCSSVHEALNGPKMSNMSYPAALVPEDPRTLTPMPERTPASANSLWRVGARTFFNDQRARTVGDIVTVLVTINDSAQTSNATTGTRTNSYSAATPTVFGLESYLGKALPAGYAPTKALGNNSTASDAGSGTIKRAEVITLTIAATVSGVLPNGNLIIKGTQEVRTDRELRQLSVEGIARPEDISAENTIKHTQLAEARISYGGTGDQSTMVKAPAAQSLMERFSPF